MKTLIYMMRHGESLGNRQKRFLGHTDLGLSEKGVAQAHAAATYIRENGICPDTVYASSLSRAYETARIATCVKPILSDGLREIYAGAWEGLLYDEIATRYPDECAVWNNDIGRSRPTGGESLKELSVRVLAAVFAIAGENEGKTVFIGTHATPIRLIELYARSIPVCDARLLPFPTNASLSAYLVEGTEILPLFYSLDSYLGALVTSFPKKL